LLFHFDRRFGPFDLSEHDGGAKGLFVGGAKLEPVSD